MILKIKRPSIIRVRYTLPNGITETHKFIGITSRIFQHEIDHLNGVLFTDHVGPVSLAMAKAKANKRMKHKNE
jgi:peptide deformylase